MVYHAQSERVKKANERDKHDKAMADAMNDYQKDQETSNKPHGLRYWANKYSVDYGTLGRHLRGSRSQTDYAATRQKLSPAQERVLVNFIKESADRGFPLNHDSIVTYANAILQADKGTDHHVGKKWIFAFLDRHRKELQTHWSKPLDSQRARALNPEAVKEWFKLVKQFIVDAGVKPENIYGMDESGFPPSHQGKERVVGGRGVKTQHKQGGGGRENVTALVTICADGTALVPMIIYKGKNMMKKWGENNIANATISCSENGWTDGELARLWIEKNFDAQTKAKAAGSVRVLLLDGHSSHYTPELLLYARENNIVILGYPPHCTHALQGLDVVCFARMKEVWKEEINRFEQINNRGVSKGDFTGVFGAAYLRAFTPDLIKAAFKETGVYPYDPNVIKPEQMKPSETTSVKASFPLPQPSPVRAIMRTFRENPPTAFDADPEHLTAPPRSPVASTSQRQLTPPGTPPMPTRRRRDEFESLDYTPSKRMRLMSANLAQTNASYLISKTSITSADLPFKPVFEAAPPLPEPDWSLMDAAAEGGQTRGEMEARIAELSQSLRQAQDHIKARNLIIEGAHAQLVVQDMHLHAQNRVIEAREKKKKDDRTMLFPHGHGRCLTGDEFTGAMVAQAASRAEDAEKRRKRVEERAEKRSKSDLVSARWKEVTDEWNLRKAQHAEECERLLAGGARKCDLPKAPTRALKKDVIAEVERELEAEESDDDEPLDEGDDGGR